VRLPILLDPLSPWIRPEGVKLRFSLKEPDGKDAVKEKLYVCPGSSDTIWFIRVWLPAGTAVPVPAYGELAKILLVEDDKKRLERVKGAVLSYVMTMSSKIEAADAFPGDARRRATAPIRPSHLTI
jgi:hypothetical protein